MRGLASLKIYHFIFLYGLLGGMILNYLHDTKERCEERDFTVFFYIGLTYYISSAVRNMAEYFKKDMVATKTEKTIDQAESYIVHFTRIVRLFPMVSALTLYYSEKVDVVEHSQWTLNVHTVMMTVTFLMMYGFLITLIWVMRNVAREDKQVEVGQKQWQEGEKRKHKGHLRGRDGRNVPDCHDGGLVGYKRLGGDHDEVLVVRRDHSHGLLGAGIYDEFPMIRCPEDFEKSNNGIKCQVNNEQKLKSCPQREMFDESIEEEEDIFEIPLEGLNQHEVPAEFVACGPQMETKRKVDLFLQLVMILLCMTPANSSLANTCKKECMEEWPDMEFYKCTAGVGLMTSKGYNRREAPKGDSISGTPLIVSVDFKVIKIFKFNLVEDQFDIVMWFEMSWVDQRIKMCGELGDIGIDVEDVDDLWLPDLHILEAKEFKDIKGLTTERESVQVVRQENEQPRVVYSLNLRAVLDCHIDTLHSIQTKNRCLVRFGSYVYDKTEVVYKQNSQFLDDQIKHSLFNLELHPLDEENKKVQMQRVTLKNTRERDDLAFAYDGIEIAVLNNITSSEVQVYVTMFILVSLALLCLFALSGYPQQIDRSSVFSATLLGSILTLVQLTDGTPDGLSPFMSFFRASIVGIMFCMAFYCILVMLTSDEMIEGEFQHRIEKGLLVISVCAYVSWLSYHIWWNI